MIALPFRKDHLQEKLAAGSFTADDLNVLGIEERPDCITDMMMSFPGHAAKKMPYLVESIYQLGLSCREGDKINVKPLSALFINRALEIFGHLAQHSGEGATALLTEMAKIENVPVTALGGIAGVSRLKEDTDHVAVKWFKAAKAFGYVTVPYVASNVYNLLVEDPLEWKKAAQVTTSQPFTEKDMKALLAVRKGPCATVPILAESYDNAVQKHRVGRSFGQMLMRAVFK